MGTITILHPKRLVFGNGCLENFVSDLTGAGFKRVFLVGAPQLIPLIEPALAALRTAAIEVTVNQSIVKEPTVEMFTGVLREVQQSAPDCVVGIGGGSVLDVAKLLAALHRNEQKIEEVFGIDKLSGRAVYLACLPTTAGTGSEVSPNAILLDSAENLKKGVISPHLVADAAYIDPLLTKTVPPAVTAATGIDALTHCIEAYANLHAHPLIDLYALEGIRLIASHLKRAVDDGEDLEAREKLALGSLYGGICLGPVNTAAVHALSYPLGSEFHIAHGVSNALLLPYVLEFNLLEAPKRYADIALTLGIEPAASKLDTAKKGIEKIKQLCRECGIPATLSQLGIPRDALEDMAKAAMTVTRLLKNNVRKMALVDAMHIYEQAY